jgi:hypothetical protein
MTVIAFFCSTLYDDPVTVRRQFSGQTAVLTPNL